MKLLTVHSHDNEAVICRLADHLNNLACSNRGGSLMVVFEGKYHPWQLNAIGHNLNLAVETTAAEGPNDYADSAQQEEGTAPLKQSNFAQSVWGGGVDLRTTRLFLSPATSRNAHPAQYDTPCAILRSEATTTRCSLSPS